MAKPHDAGVVASLVAVQRRRLDRRCSVDTA
jgi:hypothetical protein